LHVFKLDFKGLYVNGNWSRAKLLTFSVSIIQNHTTISHYLSVRHAINRHFAISKKR